MTQQISMTRLVPAPPAQVYAAWLDPALLATWWWPQIPDTTYAVDARVGGAYRIRSEATGMGVHGTVVALEEGVLIELTWTWEDGDVDGPEERVVVTFAPSGTGTLVTVVHDVRGDDAEDFRQGWSDCLARLGSVGGSVSVSG